MRHGGQLYTPGPASNAKAPLLMIQFDGSLDAGSAGSLAATQLLRNFSPQRVATFNTDQLLDYRSHRPTMEVDNWVTTKVSSPEIALDLVHDDAGTPMLILHGPEPDTRWHAFTDTVAELVETAGAEVVFTFHGLPAAVPHSRPTAVHVQSTDPDLIPKQPHMGGRAQFPAPLSSYIQYELHERGLAGVTLLAAVPYYMSDSNFPRAASAVLRRLADMADLSLPVGDLERGADEDATQVQKIVEVNPELQRTVAALEQHYDSLSQAAAEGAEIDGPEPALPGVGDVDSAGFPTWDTLAEAAAADDGAFPEAELLGEEPDDTMADVIGEAIESYLRTRSKRKEPGDLRLSTQQAETLNEGNSSQDSGERPAARHRAPAPWERVAPSGNEETSESAADPSSPEQHGNESDDQGEDEDDRH